ncbi:gustatory receptor for bitter taste 93a [Ceratitis capitata]|uniref:gustatory receptor for bitter taste 93a n=1 Tax=Ceratitis capitata TaxID=7213 RepID=UPI00032A2E68|nr:gustatory receptor for bitter taste 93a [Ceratitis capitata]
MSSYSRSERFAYLTLVALYYYGRLLCVFDWKLEKSKMLVRPTKCTNRILLLIWRIFITMIFISVMPSMMAPFQRLSIDSFLAFFANLQVITVTLFSVISFLIQELSERKIFKIIEKIVKIYKRIYGKSHVRQILGRTFVFSVITKLLLSFLGLIYEVPLILEGDQSVKSLCGIYLWLGTIYTLDACFLGFLIIGQMYTAMAAHLGEMVQAMSDYESEEPLSTLSKHERMKRLCVHSESIDDSNNIYFVLYGLTKQFHHIFRWQLIYSIYYNFVIILMVMHSFIWQYIYAGYVDFLALFSSLFKLWNLAMLILAAHGVVEKSQLPDLLNLDLVCSDIDARWDESVEAFICQRKVENLEIKVLGFFHLNNEFILVIISAIMSYLFILIQFALTKQQ